MNLYQAAKDGEEYLGGELPCGKEPTQNLSMGEIPSPRFIREISCSPLALGSSPKPIRIKLPFGQYTAEERRQGGLNRAAQINDKQKGMIADSLQVYISMGVVDGTKFTMSGFLAYVFPLMKGISTLRGRHGNYIKALLKKYEGIEIVEKFGRFVDAIRAGQAKKRNKPAPTPVFAAMRGFFVRVQGTIFQTSREFHSKWQEKIGCWGYWADPLTGEVL